MARNYKIGEVVEIIAEGKDVEAIQDLGRKYPLLVAKVAKVTAGNNIKEITELFSYIPEYVSANKVNKLIREAAGLLGAKEAEDADDVEDAAEEAEEKPAKKKAPAKKSGGKYDGKDAIELFKECKKRGIKAAPKKTAKYYIGLLEKADAELAEADDAEDADDDWDEGDDSDEEPVKKKEPAKKKAAAAKKKPEPEEDEDDDDDWDI